MRSVHSRRPGPWSVQDDRGFHAKVSDFGLAVHMAQETTTSKLQGTEAYLPPQVYFDHELTQASDMYAFGLVLWEMLHGILWCYVWDAEKRRRGCAYPPTARTLLPHALVPHAHAWPCP